VRSKAGVFGVLALSGVLVLAGCAKGSGSVKPADKASASAAASAIINSPSGKQAKEVVEKCESEHGQDPLSKADRECIVPPGHGPAFAECVLKAAAGANLSTAAGREELGETKLVVCVVDNR
jgi:hypothetical protein